MAHNTKSGVAHFASENDAESIEKIKTLLSYLPSNNTEASPFVDTGDDPERMDESLDTLVPENPRKIYDMKKVIRSIVDNVRSLNLTSIMPAINLLLCEDGRRTIGIIANQPNHLAGALTSMLRIRQAGLSGFAMPSTSPCSLSPMCLVTSRAATRSGGESSATAQRFCGLIPRLRCPR